jgi:ketosteroid isomerase-like protein
VSLPIAGQPATDRPASTRRRDGTSEAQSFGYPSAMAEMIEDVRALFLDLGRNPDAALATIPELYAEDMTFRDPIQEVHGRDAFVEVTRRLIDRARTLEVDVHDCAHSDDTLFIAWTMQVALPVGPRVTFEGVSRLGLDDGRIKSQRDYFDLLGSMLGTVPGLRTVYRTILRRLA